MDEDFDVYAAVGVAHTQFSFEVSIVRRELSMDELYVLARYLKGSTKSESLREKYFTGRSIASYRILQERILRNFPFLSDFSCREKQ